MKKILNTLLFVLFINMTMAQSFYAFIEYVNELPEAERQIAVDDFITTITPYGFPYINSDTANFIYLGTPSSANVASDFNAWDNTSLPMTNVVATNLWYYFRIFEMDARLDYKFVLDGSEWILDPLNPNTVMGGYGPNSELAMPDYIQPWEIEAIAGTPTGTIETFSIASANTGSTFQLKVYLPYNYNANRPEAYAAAYFQDGFEYVSFANADIVLDNLINVGVLDTIIAVFVKPNNRNAEYAGNMRNLYRLFFVEELVPYIDENYNTLQEATARAICGPSFGGNISALISYKHPDVFGNCGLQSGALWPNDFEVYQMIINGPLKEIKWASVWGSYESLYENMRDLRDFLLENDYDLKWLERPEGHSWGLWRATIDEILPFFFPGSAVAVDEISAPIITELQVYPNPFSDGVTIEYKLQQVSVVHLSIYNLLGQLVYEYSEDQSQCLQKFQWTAENQPKGIYLYRIQAGDHILMGKFVKSK